MSNPETMQQTDAFNAFSVQPLIDAMLDSAAVVARDGTIVAVNRAWRQFGSENNGEPLIDNVGQNYFNICSSSSGDGAELANHVVTGISNVFASGKEFRCEYPCHSETQKRWFEVAATRFELTGEQFALIAHRNITSKVQSKFDAADAQQNAQELAAIVSTMPDAVMAFDLEGRITSWNAAAKYLYGYERDEAIGQSMEILYPPNWPKRIKEYIAEIVASELRYFDAVRLTKSGESRTIAITAAPIRAGSGEIVGISNVHRDVSEERHAEQRLRSVLDNLFAFVGVLELDGTLVEANRAPLEMAGLEAKDVIGKKFWDCFWWNYGASAQEQLKVDCERAGAGEVVRYDTKVRVAGGDLVWIDFQMAPMRDPSGTIVNLIPSGIDISERKAMDLALRTSNETFQNMVAHSPFGIYTVDADFRIAHVSDGAQTVFKNVRPLEGHDFSKALRILWPEPFATETIELFRHTLETGEPYHSTSTVEHRQDSDEVGAYDWKIERLTMPDGRLGVVCNFYDLSERQQYEQHIKLLMQEVNHRSKNLLTVVSSIARQTARTTPHDKFSDRFSQRLGGLSASQDLIVQRNWDGVEVRDLVLSQLEHLGDEIIDQRVILAGPDLTISPSAAEGIGMAMHELSTNALKYGSLSGLVGTVSIEWDIQGRDRTFHLRWRERDGPVVTPPERSGFGRTVIERMAANSVGGTVELKYEPSGAEWTLTAPLSEIEMIARS